MQRQKAEQERKDREEERRGAERKQREKVLRQKETALNHMRSMSGVEFENFLAAFFRRQGYIVNTTPGSGDQGADLLLYKEDRSIAVQVKQWQGSIGNSAIREAHAGRTFYNTFEAWVITTSFFTGKAVEAARHMGVRLIDGTELAQQVSSTFREG
jgi:restriction system protein